MGTLTVVFVRHVVLSVVWHLKCTDTCSFEYTVSVSDPWGIHTQLPVRGPSSQHANAWISTVTSAWDGQLVEGLDVFTHAPCPETSSPDSWGLSALALKVHDCPGHRGAMMSRKDAGASRLGPSRLGSGCSTGVGAVAPGSGSLTAGGAAVAARSAVAARTSRRFLIGCLIVAPWCWWVAFDLAADTGRAPPSGGSGLAITTAAATLDKESSRRRRQCQLHGHILPGPISQRSAKRLPTCGRHLPTFWQVLAGWWLQFAPLLG